MAAAKGPRLPALLVFLLLWSIVQVSGASAALDPILQNPSVTAVSTSLVTISWNTTVPTTAQVYFGKTPLLGNKSNRISYFASDHTIGLFPLESNTTYYYRIESTTETGSIHVYTSTFSTFAGRIWYASPNGSASASGTKVAPIELQTVFASAAVRPGDTIFLLGGKYISSTQGPISKSYVQANNGLQGRPVIIAQYPGARSIVDGSINAYGSHTYFVDFEMTNSDSINRTASALNRYGGLNMFGNGSKAINMIIHNVAHPAIGFWSPVEDGGEIYGVLMWGNGLYDTSTNSIRGSGVYAQNRVGRRYMQDMISFRQFTTGFKAFGSAAHVNGFQFIGNMNFDNSEANLFLGLQDHPMQDIRIEDNYMYGIHSVGMALGYYAPVVFPSPTNRDVIIRDNYIVGGRGVIGSSGGTALVLKSWDNITMVGNVVAAGSTSIIVAYDTPRPNDTLRYAEVNNNQYFGGWRHGAFGGGIVASFRVNDSIHNISMWRNTTKFDENSTYSVNLPMQNSVFIRPNKYRAGRANMALYNWQNSTTISVDISGIGISVGDSLQVYDAQNYFGAPVYSTVFTGDPITLPLILSNVSAIPGVTHFENVHTPPEFNVFILEYAPSVTLRPGDINGDRTYTSSDLQLLIAELGKSAGFAPRSDANDDGKIDLYDFVAIAKNWGMNY